MNDYSKSFQRNYVTLIYSVEMNAQSFKIRELIKFD